MRRFLFLLGLGLGATALSAAWEQSPRALTWRAEDGGGWTFSFDANAGKPFFHPLSVAGGPSLTHFKPEDHPWHYGLWFSWKYLNDANYWEESRTTGRAEGATRWTPPELELGDDGRVTIRLALSYVHPSGRVDLTERRVLTLSAPAEDGSYTLEWDAQFTAGPAGARLERTPMPGEPGGQVNGGYAGLGVRLAAPPLALQVVSTQAVIDAFVSDRARPAAPAVALNFADGAEPAGAIAILSDPRNAGPDAPWYLVDSAQMRFACAAILAPAPRQYAAGATFTLRYRIVWRRLPWTPAALTAAHASWVTSR